MPLSPKCVPITNPNRFLHSHYNLDLARFQAERAPIPVKHAAHYHLPDDRLHINKMRAVQRIAELNKVVDQLNRRQIALQVFGCNLTHLSLALSGGALAAIAFTTLGSMALWSHVRKRREQWKRERGIRGRITFARRRASESARELKQIYEIPLDTRELDRLLPMLPVTWRPL